MAIFGGLRTALAYRRIVRELVALRQIQERHTVALERLADQFAPRPPAVQPTELADTGLSYVNAAEQARVDQLREAARKSGRPDPSDEDIDALLRDEELLTSGGGRR